MEVNCSLHSVLSWMISNNTCHEMVWNTHSQAFRKNSLNGCLNVYQEPMEERCAGASGGVS